MPFARSNDGVDLAITDLGGTGRETLLAHATSFASAMYVPLARELESVVHCFAYDTRGHGQSRPVEQMAVSWEILATDALTVETTLGLERPFGIGHSAGGSALLLAEAMA